jgi:hypothetical protein
MPTAIETDSSPGCCDARTLCPRQTWATLWRIDYRTDRTVLIKAKQGEVPAHTHRAAGTETVPKVRRARCSSSSLVPPLRVPPMIPDEKLD